MGKPLDIERLERLIALVDDKLKSVPKINVSDPESFRHYNVALNQIVLDLAASEEAKFRISCGAYTMRMAGINTSCTSGHDGLLKNWRNAADNAVRTAKAGAL